MDIVLPLKCYMLCLTLGGSMFFKITWNKKNIEKMTIKLSFLQRILLSFMIYYIQHST